MSFDAVVIGAGLSGMVAGVRAAEAGAKVLVLAKGAGSTQLAPSTIDVLGYDPERVESPLSALPGFIERHPDHPYARLGVEPVRSALGWFAERFTGYRGGLERNHLLPTALGVAKPSALVPESMTGGDLRSQRPVCVVGLRPLRDFHAALMADNLARITGLSARGVELELRLEGGRPDENAVGLA
ncbi:MAG: FAD-binding protein, partial [Solirubrobacterales bacterium]|nr:FAD-binding protein [Solirubrobacterales bacterium]